jgi:leucyl-tRNA synthetase
MWSRIGGTYSVHNQLWPVFDPELAAEDSVEMVIQINGKIKDRITVPAGSSEETVKEAVLGRSIVQEAMEGKTIKKFIVVPGRLVNLVVG